MIYVGIDVAKDKHDCFITNSDGEVLFKAFTITNNLDGFNELYQKIVSVMEDVTKVKVGLEATGHYSYNLLGYLIDKGLPTYVINPLHTNLYRKSLSLRQTKTDKVDARTIASMLMSDVNLKSYSDTSYHNEELKSLTRYRFDKVKVSRVELLFPPTAALPQIKSDISFILSILTCCFLRHVFFCPLDHFPSFPYSLFVTNRKRERTAPPTVRSFSSPIQVLQKQVRCRVMP